MIELLLVGFVAGIVAGISPCILPVLPVALAAVAARGDGETAVSSRRARLRPVALVLGVVVSFSFVVLVGAEVLSALHLPEDFLRAAGIGVLIVIGVGLIVPRVAELLERPFARLGTPQPDGSRRPFVLGLAMGALFVPCAGPILAAITVVGATHRVGFTALALTVSFGVGAALPLLLVAGAGNEAVRRVKALRSHGPTLRRVSGVVLVGMAVAIGANALDGLQRALPGYTSALQSHLEGSASIRGDIASLEGTDKASLAHCRADTPGLENCGPAPAFTAITSWLNTPGGRPLSLADLRGQVVLVDFWTYSCVNCQRTLPHLEGWYRDYAKDGFVIVGVHTPEFAFEHVASNVRAEASALGVRYPVAIDDGYGTWDAYDNEYWPAEYLIDPQGDVVHEHFGEGDYSTTEGLIRELLAKAHPDLTLPPSTDVPNETPSGPLSPETYVGYERVRYLLPADAVTPNVPAVYHFPASVSLGGFGLAGTWDDRAQEATAGPGAELELDFVATDVYLVLGGEGRLEASLRGQRLETITVGGVPRLYTLVHGATLTDGVLLLRASPGVQVYDFTFG